MVSMTRSRENGDSLNLTCKLDCSGNLEVQWFKNGKLMQHSHPVLTFSSVTTKDSGNYSCSLRNFKTTVSEEFRIHIEGGAHRDFMLSLPSRLFPPTRKKQQGRGAQRLELRELTLAQPLHASPSPTREPSPVLFSRPEQRPLAEASDLISFGCLEDEPLDDSMSLAASEMEEWAGDSEDPAHLPSLEPIDARAGMDAELFRVLSKAVEELDLE
ncbi:hypothetical protein DPX16_14132 [Anabarilius grahami]|uniref:Ig-like domain-containing protein n=1 Tax=Anabarilius grahami TaxID=495550 RepID=A0A3N0Z3P2_ANAGA|nr:hypothetical protein DPX16_14132 [Anabarilius grahami]